MRRPRRPGHPADHQLPRGRRTAHLRRPVERSPTRAARGLHRPPVRQLSTGRCPRRAIGRGAMTDSSTFSPSTPAPSPQSAMPPSTRIGPTRGQRLLGPTRRSGESHRTRQPSRRGPDGNRVAKQLARLRGGRTRPDAGCPPARRGHPRPQRGRGRPPAHPHHLRQCRRGDVRLALLISENHLIAAQLDYQSDPAESSRTSSTTTCCAAA